MGVWDHGEEVCEDGVVDVDVGDWRGSSWKAKAEGWSSVRYVCLCVCMYVSASYITAGQNLGYGGSSVAKSVKV